MEKINFNVSSKTARLIGRENISDSNGAIIELVKNAYDADATNVYIEFNIPFENIPKEIIISDNKDYFNDKEIKNLLLFYDQDGDILKKKQNLSSKQEDDLKEILFNKNRIVIFDNGTGMNEEIIKTVWMNIGTNDKEINTFSKKGRVKTGAKGIGRFALEKLSQTTTVYTKKEKNDLVYWNLDWKQFESKTFLGEINAEMEVLDLNFNDVVSHHINLLELEQRNIKFDSGTLIILSGTRDIWSDRIYSRINNNLKSINPFGNVDKFDVYINNKIKKEFNYIPENTYLSSDDYDYIIKAKYDGFEEVTISLTRNEVNLFAKTEHRIINNKTYSFNIDEFWSREAFKHYPYKKENYSSIFEQKFKVVDLMKNATFEEIKKIGKFDLQFYFLKSGKSEFNFIKDIKVNRRKQLLSSFSGIKIYRDNFKVRPYGEDGPMYDWLQLGSRVQASPAGITHPTGYWRTNTYQLIGNVNISRIENPNLVDMANREGLTLNDTYYLFVELIQSIISKFEYDRQYIYREYGDWLKKCEKAITPIDAIRNSVVEEKEKKKKPEIEFSNEEYKEALYQTINDKQKSIDTQRVLMNFSTVGVTANTFAHEMKGISTNLSTRNEQLKICIQSILDNKDYVGPDYLNPFTSLESGKENDILLSKWLKLIMDSVSKINSLKEEISLKNFFEELYDDWCGLLEKKLITLNVNCEKEIFVECEKIDLFLIFNNLILNSAFFLEQSVNGNNRLINISISEEKKDIIFIIENNGPKLDNKYSNTPDIIFNAGETTKEKGTGLGLWICKEAVNRNNGEIHVVPCDSGFKLKIKWPKVD